MPTDPSALHHAHIPINQPGVSALDWVFTQGQPSTLEPLSKQQLKACFDKGAVWHTPYTQHNGHSLITHTKTVRLRRVKKVLAVGDTLDFYYQPNVLNQTVPPATLVADFGDYSVWIKPRGMLSQGSKWGDFTALYRWVEMHYAPNGQTRQAWIVHRLDRATAGLMLLAHTKKMAQTLSHYFETGQIHKTYQANVWGNWGDTLNIQGTLTLTQPIDDKSAISHLTLRSQGVGMARVAIAIDTGRKHQIRRHLAAVGLPIMGDRLYGDAQQDATLAQRPNCQLTAYQLRFTCPISQALHHFELSESQLDLLDILDPPPMSLMSPKSND
ncbi:RluA family pseudouridine synthase [Thiomicrorhabdus aquaedulcis]|uniref:RluA family pseudouridine synthase n=1 Tax=Thiomicrorhabdus aquaedulcis TaxID=2211106 RepID=UPI001562B49B|nr:RluA family pseudouridine synthase [Thiomicrorhabdus aquaedulcis]